MAIPEKSFGVANTEYSYIRPPPGTYVDYSHSRQANTIFATGNKTWETVAYGALQGSWTWSFTMDYDYLEPFMLAFEGYSCEEAKDESGASYDPPRFIHSFYKSNNARVRSFGLRFARLNRMTGNLQGQDEIVELSGCVVKSVKFSMAGGASPVQVSLSGLYATEKMTLGKLLTTDYNEYKGDIVEFSCLTIGGEKVAATESLSVNIDNSAEMIYSTCTPFAVNYAEGQTSYAFSTTAYADDPQKWHTRVYSGGYDKTATKPHSKGMRPIPSLEISSFNSELNIGETIADAMSNATKTATFTMNDVVLQSIQWQRGDGAKLMDSLSSLKCRLISLQVKNATEDMSTENRHKAELAMITTE